MDENVDGAFGDPDDVLIASSWQSWAEDPLDGLTGTAVTPTHSAFVLSEIRTQDPVTAHMLAFAADTDVYCVRAAGCAIHNSCGSLRVKVEAFC